MGNYKLRCLAGGEILPENYTLACKTHPGFIRAEYAARQIRDRTNEPGMFRYLDWLPVHSSLPTKTEPVTFQSDGISRELGLSNLYITFTGWYPERGCFAKTGSFKELEALPTYLRLRENGGGTLVVASAGNTGRAFAQMAADFGMPVVIVVPAEAVDKIWVAAESVPETVTLVAVEGDYSDAIAAADELCKKPHFFPEGGGKNIARRDGMGTVMLSAALYLKRLPDHYFQAVGSGTGGIAAWEAAARLIEDGRFGTKLPRLHLAQNSPFVPMVHAWNRHSRTLDPGDYPADPKTAIRDVDAAVLTNRFPPYSITGGVYDALTACNGSMYAVSNAEAKAAAKLFAESENGIDLDPAAAVALAALEKAVQTETVSEKDIIVLNCTGGGYKRIRQDCPVTYIPKRLHLKAGGVI